MVASAAASTNAHHKALVLRRRQLLGFPHHEEQRDRQQAQADPDDIDGRTGGERGVQHAAVGPAEAVEITVDAAGQAVLLASGVEQPGGHHRGEGEGDDAGNKDRAGEGEGEFAEGEDSYDATAMLAHQPEAIVFVESAQQVSDVLKLANAEGFRVVPRGSGTNLSGGTIPVENGIVLVTVKMDRILEIDPRNLTALVQPGVLTEKIDEEAAKYGLFYPPDPGSIKVSTIGGNVAENSGGLRGLKYGVTRDYVLGLEVVLPTGELLRCGTKCVKDVAGYSDQGPVHW